MAVRMVEYVLSGKSKDECSGDVHALLNGEEHVAPYHKGGPQAIILLNYNLLCNTFMCVHLSYRNALRLRDWKTSCSVYM